MAYPIRRRFKLRNPGLRPRNGAVVWTLAGGPRAMMVPLPPLKTQGDIQYVTGGIGEAEYIALRQAQCKFPLALEFIRRAADYDAYVADVDVVVIDEHGVEVLAVRSDGPYLLAKLPDGDYTVRATYFGHTLERDVRVAASASARVALVWKMKL
jgi:hypothetical protein